MLIFLLGANRLIFLLGANRPGAKRLRGRNDQGRNDLGRNAAGAKRLGGELDLERNDPDSCFVSSTSNIVYVGVPAQVLADGHAQILRCIHRL